MAGMGEHRKSNQSVDASRFSRRSSIEVRKIIDQMDKKQDKPLNRYLKVLGVVLLIGFLITMISVILVKHFHIRFWDWLVSHLQFFRDLSTEHHFLFLLAIFGFTLLDFALLLPFYVPLYVLFAYFIGDLKSAIITLTVIPILVSLTLFFFTQKFLRFAIEGYLEKYPFLKLMSPSTPTEHYINALLLRFIYAPMGIKEYILSFFRFRIDAVLLTGLLFFGVHAVILSLVGLRLEDADEIFKLKSWREKSKAEKFEFSFAVGMIALTGVLFVLLPWFAMRKFRQVKEADIDDELANEAEEEDQESLVN